ncbi:RNA-binding protein 40 [Trichogramma pretiosum]|uniref:RNA-binding protein 40 n=1 Tax=Trichogramma pretiosum TaxID=7493 RepID=UPI0006C988D1|nr:RNA-binding protein 40 [Trichogramma pretiosum]
MNQPSDIKEIATLRVLHLPPLLSDERRDELFKHYGAVRTRTIRKSAKYTITFVEFPNQRHAEEVLAVLHQLPVKGRRLSIEFAERNVSAADKENTIQNEDSIKADVDLEQSKINFQKFMKKLNTWAPFHVLTQPVPPSLRYKYPEPSANVLLKIAMQLHRVPAFYTQVLHLMNKMNLPAPFDNFEERDPLIKDAYKDIGSFREFLGVQELNKNNRESLLHSYSESEMLYTKSTQDMQNLFVPQQVNDVQEPSEIVEEDDESELESDHEMSSTSENIIPLKRKRAQLTNRPKIPKFFNPYKQPANLSTGSKPKPQDMFDLPQVSSRKIQVKPIESVKLLSESTPPFIVEKNTEVEGFGLITAVMNTEEETEKGEKGQLENVPECIDSEQLAKNKISASDQRLLPVFKNYHPGKPSNRLYIKNLAKQVEENDLHSIYRKYILPDSNPGESEYNVRLMQEGRMKGQAFITLPNITQAQLALNETNGYILKEKPIVVQFAKAAKS